MKTKFRRGQRVWYNLPEGEAGIVLDIKVFASDLSSPEYLVGFGPGSAAWCLELELSETQVF